VQALKASVQEDGELEPQARWSVTREYTLMYESTTRQIGALGEPKGTNSLESSHPGLSCLPLLVLLLTRPQHLGYVIIRVNVFQLSFTILRKAHTSVQFNLACSLLEASLWNFIVSLSTRTTCANLLSLFLSAPDAFKLESQNLFPNFKMHQ
jgi:hypothetical protein